MLYEDINWGRLIKDTPVEELELEDEASCELWTEVFGDTSKFFKYSTGQGGGNGIYIADINQQKVFQTIRNEIVKLNNTNGGCIKSEPLNPNGSNAYISSVAPSYIIRDMKTFLLVVGLMKGFSFMQYDNGTIHFLSLVGQLFQKVESEETIKRKQQVFDQLNSMFNHESQRSIYEPLDDASLELIFFNDTNLEYDPALYNMEKVRGITAVKNYFDFLTDIDYNNDDDPEAGRGGVTSVIYDSAYNIAKVDCFINELSTYCDKTLDDNNCPYNEIMPILKSVDHMAVRPAFNNQEQTFIWLSFAVRNIRRS